MHRLRFSFEHLFNCFCTQDSTFPGEVNGFPAGPSDWRKGISKWSKAPSKRPLVPLVGVIEYSCKTILGREATAMEANWTQTITSIWQRCPSGTLVEVSPTGRNTCIHQPPLTGRGFTGALPSLPGAVLTHLGVLGGVLPTPPRRPGLRPGDHPLPPGPGWGGRCRKASPLYLGPGDLALHPMACCAHSLLRFPLEGYEGFLPLPGRGDLKGPPAPCPGPGKGRPWLSCWRSSAPGEACRPPRRGGPGPHLPPPL